MQVHVWCCITYWCSVGYLLIVIVKGNPLVHTTNKDFITKENGSKLFDCLKQLKQSLVFLTLFKKSNVPDSENFPKKCVL